MAEKRENEIIVGCDAMRTEVEDAVRRLGIVRETIWMESGLHNTPTILTSKLQETLDGLSNYDRVLLMYANCGNAIQNLVSGDFELIVPRLDDCISMLIGSQEKRIAYSRELAAIYLTGGQSGNVLKIYDETVEKYGEEMADDIFTMMYRHYRTLAFLDTGLYDIATLEKETQQMTELLKLDHKVLPATLSYVDELISGPWPEERFVHVPPHTKVPTGCFMPGDPMAI